MRGDFLWGLGYSPEAMPHTSRHIFVSGRVQGVAFRWHTRDQALHLGLTGWVRNLADGRVEAWIEGEDAAVDEMRRWLATGPSHAHVTSTDVREGEAKGCTGFSIRPTSM